MYPAWFIIVIQLNRVPKRSPARTTLQRALDWRGYGVLSCVIGLLAITLAVVQLDEREIPSATNTTEIKIPRTTQQNFANAQLDVLFNRGSRQAPSASSDTRRVGAQVHKLEQIVDAQLDVLFNRGSRQAPSASSDTRRVGAQVHKLEQIVDAQLDMLFNRGSRQAPSASSDTRRVGAQVHKLEQIVNAQLNALTTANGTTPTKQSSQTSRFQVKACYADTGAQNVWPSQNKFLGTAL